MLWISGEDENDILNRVAILSCFPNMLWIREFQRTPDCSNNYYASSLLKFRMIAP